MSKKFSLPSPIRKFANIPAATSLIPPPEFLPDYSETEASAMGSTSILEEKPFSGTAHHFFYAKNSGTDSKKLSETKYHPWDVSDSKTVGLKILDALNNEKVDKKSSKVGTRMVLFGSQLKVQIPSTSQNSVFQAGSEESPQSLIEFGVKNKNSQLAMALLSPARKSSFAAATSPTSKPSLPILCLPTSEMELSEDYTRVVSHGPNPKTTHIFDTCVMESCSIGFNSMREIRFSIDESSGYPSKDLLAFCNACKKKLEQGRDIFMYRGEKAYCSHECRSKQMFFDNEPENSARCGQANGFRDF